MASSEQDKRLRAELAEGLGFYPASLAPEDVARYREQIVERKAREEAGEREGWEPGAYKWHKWFMASHRPTRCALRSQAMSPSRGSDPDSRGRQSRPPGLGPVAPAAAAA